MTHWPDLYSGGVSTPPFYMNNETITDSTLSNSSLRAVFARNLELWLFCNNMHSVQLAKKMLMSANSVYRLQKGELSTVNFDTLDKLVEVTGKPISYFFTRQPGVVYS